MLLQDLFVYSELPRERESSSIGSLPRWPRWLGLGQIKARRQELHLTWSVSGLGQVPPSLDNLETPGSTRNPMLVPSPVWTPAPHSTAAPISRAPAIRWPLPPEELQLQACTTTPGQELLLSLSYGWHRPKHAGNLALLFSQASAENRIGSGGGGVGPRSHRMLARQVAALRAMPQHQPLIF